MFESRSLSGPAAAVQEAYAPDCLVLDVAADFETLPPETAEELGLLADGLDPATYPTEWLPPDAPQILRRYAGTDFTIGTPGDGTVVWSRQTTPPTVLVKRRAEGTPDDFLQFLLAEAFVELAVGVPEQFLPFFGTSYTDLAETTPTDPADTYQLAAALFDAWAGLHTREVFASWDPDSETDPATALADVSGTESVGELPTHPALFDAWVDAGDRLAGRLDDLAGEIARGETTFPEATEYACAAVKHGLELPAPFGALDTAAYRDHGADFAVEWAHKTYEQLEE
ncbi:hypothetical protein [Halobaculum sp. MBLA0143]|uniref:DUF7089 family protein n=1 Tax=Halobaculum sp. MBLA0143 TaxID=3079933 RepID=UPI0035234844